MMNLKKLFGGIAMMLVLSVSGQTSLLAQNSSTGKTIKVSGSVCDENKDPLPGAYVFVNELRNGTVTDINGNFSVDAPSDGHLTFSFLGMQDESVAVLGRSTINVNLISATNALEDVVVTGYQSLSKERSAGSASVIGGPRLADKAAARGSVLQSLDGLAAGLQFKSNEDAEYGTQYVVRGITSVFSTQSPLFVIDGVAVSATDVENLLNGTDVSSVTVLKDATAASIWGAQAANGVIVIETKAGHNTNGRYSVSYSGTYTYKGLPDYKYMDMMDTPTFLKNAQEVFDMTKDNYTLPKILSGNTGVNNWGYLRNPNVMPHETLLYQHDAGEISDAEFQSQWDALSKLNQREQYEKYMMSKAWSTIQSVSVEGGNDKSQLFTSFTYDGNRGTEKDYNENVKLNIREVYNISKNIRLDLGFNASLNNKKAHAGMTNGSDRGVMYKMGVTDLPYAVFYDENGNAVDHSIYDMQASLKQTAEGLLGYGLDYYPVDDFNATMNNTKSMSLRANAGLTIKIIDGLKYEGRFAYLRSSSNSELYYPGDTYFSRYERGISYNTATNKQSGPATGGNYTVGNSTGKDWTVRNQLSFDRNFSDIHQVTALAGFEFRERSLSGNTMLKRGYDYQTMTSAVYDITGFTSGGTAFANSLLYPAMCTKIALAALANMYWPNNVDKFSTSDDVYRYFSAYANAAYTYARKYSVNASIRVDQSNLFGSDPSAQFKPVWSLGANWNAKNEDFLKNVADLSSLTVRFSYGIGGNAPKPGLASPYTILNATTNNYYPGTTYSIGTAANARVVWEKTRTINFGVDFAAFKHRFWGSLDIYDKYTTNLLGTNQIDPTNGFISLYTNNGELSNKGVELNLAGDVVRSGMFTWNSNLIFSYNKNKVLKFYKAPFSGASSALTETTYLEGYEYGPYFALKWAGLDPEDGSPRVYNKDGEIVKKFSSLTPDDVYHVGTRFAPVTGSWSNTFRYKNFSLSAMFVYNFGNKILDDVWRMKASRLTANLANDFDRRWRKPGDENTTKIPSVWVDTDTVRKGNNETSLFLYSDCNVLDGSYIKLRELKFAYELPASVCRSIAMNSASVFAQANNLWFWAANKEGIDPEYISTTGWARTAKFGATYTIGLNLKF